MRGQLCWCSYPVCRPGGRWSSAASARTPPWRTEHRDKQERVENSVDGSRLELMRTCLRYLPADQRVPQSLQQRLDLTGRWKLLFSPRADRNAQHLLHNEATASTLASARSLGHVLAAKRQTFISMKTSEGRGAAWGQSGGQDAALWLPCFLLGVVALSALTTSNPTSQRSKAGGPPTSFITRSYLLFHSRLIRAGVGTHTQNTQIKKMQHTDGSDQSRRASRRRLPVMLPMSQLQAFSVARRLVMFSDVISTCRGGESLNGCEATHMMGFSQDSQRRRSHRGAESEWPWGFSRCRICKSRQETTHQGT